MFFEQNQDQQSEKIEKDLHSLLFQIESSKAKIDQYLSNIEMNEDDFLEMMNNRKNFSSKQWAYIEESRTLLKKAEAAVRADLTIPRNKKLPHVQKHWLFCR